MNKKLIIFDLDGCLTESKQPINLDLVERLEALLHCYYIAILAGASYLQFKDQIIDRLPISDQLTEKLILLPTNGSACYKFNNTWNKIYSEDLSSSEKELILSAFKLCFQELNFTIPKKPLYGEILEDRGPQITFSGLGQRAPLPLKKKWDPNHLFRLQMIEILSYELKNFEIKSGGFTSLDINKLNHDKSFGISKLLEIFNFKLNDLLFIGNFQLNGSNFPVKKMGLECWETSSPDNTKVLIKQLLEK